MTLTKAYGGNDAKGICLGKREREAVERELENNGGS
jgi:hypothetical protein